MPSAITGTCHLVTGSIDAAYREHVKHCEQGQTRGKRAAGFWQSWSTKHDWVSRATAHDADLSHQRRQRRAKELERAYLLAYRLPLS